jgi:hypothetical protein
VILYLGGTGFFPQISEIDKVTEQNIVSMCIDDSSMIFLFPLHICFQSIIFSVKLFSDNN